MSEHDDHEGGRRRSSGGGVGRWITLGGWALAAILGGNLIIGNLRTGEGDRPSGFLTDTVVRTAAFWLPIVVLAGASLLGLLWTMKVYARREKSSLLWMRNAYVFGLVAAVLLIVGCLDARNFPREWLAAWCAAVAAAQVSFFAYASFREMRRTSGHHRGGGSGEGD